jgi:hypothetical protein
MFSMSDTNTPIEQYGGPMGVLTDAIQKVTHTKVHNSQNGSYYTFTAFDAFNSHEFNCGENLDCHAKPTIYPCNNEFQLQHHSEINKSM